MAQTQVILIVLVIISMVNAKGNDANYSYKISRTNIIHKTKSNYVYIYIYYLGKFVCSRKANKPFKTSKSWSKSPYHGTVYYFPDTITSTGRCLAQDFLLYISDVILIKQVFCFVIFLVVLII